MSSVNSTIGRHMGLELFQQLRWVQVRVCSILVVVCGSVFPLFPMPSPTAEPPAASQPWLLWNRAAAAAATTVAPAAPTPHETATRRGELGNPALPRRDLEIQVFQWEGWPCSFVAPSFWLGLKRNSGNSWYQKRWYEAEGSLVKLPTY